MFELHGSHFLFSGIVNFNDQESHHLSKNFYYVAKECETIESNSDE